MDFLCGVNPAGRTSEPSDESSAWFFLCRVNAALGTRGEIHVTSRKKISVPSSGKCNSATFSSSSFGQVEPEIKVHKALSRRRNNRRHHHWNFLIPAEPHCTAQQGLRPPCRRNARQRACKRPCPRTGGPKRSATAEHPQLSAPSRPGHCRCTTGTTIFPRTAIRNLNGLLHSLHEGVTCHRGITAMYQTVFSRDCTPSSELLGLVAA